MSVGVERIENELVLKLDVREASKLMEELGAVTGQPESAVVQLYLTLASQNLEYHPGYGVSDHVGDVQPLGVDGICADAA